MTKAKTYANATTNNAATTKKTNDFFILNDRNLTRQLMLFYQTNINFEESSLL